MSAMGTAPPAWVRDLPTKPTLGDLAPGTAGQAVQVERRERFVPVAKPQPVAQPSVPAFPAPAPVPAPQPVSPNEHVRSATYPPPPVALDAGVPVRQAVAPGWEPPEPEVPGVCTPAGEAYAPSQAPVAAPLPAAAPHPSPHQPAPQTAPQPAPQSPPQPSPQPPPVASQPAAQPPPPPRRGPAPAAPQALSPEQGQSLDMSVSTYASFCAACAAMPDRVAETQLEYGITSPQQRASLDDLWQDRFDEDPALQQHWEKMFAQFRDQIRRSQR